MWPPSSIKLKMLIAILPLLLFNTKQTSAQETTTAPAKNYGLGGYKMDDDKKTVMVPDGVLLLKTTEDVKKYKTNNHMDKQFKPCRVELNKGEGNEFEVFYDEDTANEGCTVDFVMDEIDKITTRIKVTDTEMGCLTDCGRNEMAASSKNIVPFTYSMSNAEFMDVHDDPYYDGDEKDERCKEKQDCAENGGKCMGSATSLQLAWTKCAKDAIKARAWIQLVGEPISEWSAEIEDESEENPDEAIIQLSIEMGDNPGFPDNKFQVPLFTVAGQTGSKSFLQPYYPACFLDNKIAMIPEPKFWTIKSNNAELNGKHLLVFHLLPQAATRIFNEKGILQNDQAPEMPNCKGKLSIIFENVAGLLQSPTGTTGTGPSDGTMEPNANATSATTGPGEGMSIGIILAIVGGVVLLLIVVAVLVWFFFCRDKKEDASEEDAEAGANTEKESAKEEGAEAEKKSAKEEGEEYAPVAAE